VVFSLDPSYYRFFVLFTGRAGSLCLALELEFLQKSVIGGRIMAAVTFFRAMSPWRRAPLGLLVDFDGACFHIICSVSASEVLGGQCMRLNRLVFSNQKE
jgi:hypothetical protein